MEILYQQLIWQNTYTPYTDFFEPDYEVVTYDYPEECLEKINFLRENPIERDKIAERGQARTLRDHTFEQRGKVLMEILNY